MIKKKIYIALGCIFFALGLFGYYMPVMPGTIFMIIAAYFFMHSSDRLYTKIIKNPYYGGPIKNYIENHVIPFRTKVIILLSMWVATLATAYIAPPMRFPLGLQVYGIELAVNLKVLGIILSLIGSAVVLRAKNK